jgi:hypothetical protein
MALMHSKTGLAAEVSLFFQEMSTAGLGATNRAERQSQITSAPTLSGVNLAAKRQPTHSGRKLFLEARNLVLTVNSLRSPRVKIAAAPASSRSLALPSV